MYIRLSIVIFLVAFSLNSSALTPPQAIVFLDKEKGGFYLKADTRKLEGDFYWKANPVHLVYTPSCHISKKETTDNNIYNLINLLDLYEQLNDDRSIYKEVLHERCGLPKLELKIFWFGSNEIHDEVFNELGDTSTFQPKVSINGSDLINSGGYSESAEANFKKLQKEINNNKNSPIILSIEGIPAATIDTSYIKKSEFDSKRIIFEKIKESEHRNVYLKIISMFIATIVGLSIAAWLLYKSTTRHLIPTTNMISGISVVIYGVISKNSSVITGNIKKSLAPSFIIKSKRLNSFSVADELLKWNELKEKGVITDDQYEEARKKLLNDR